jgi:hypothetical protein
MLVVFGATIRLDAVAASPNQCPPQFHQQPHPLSTRISDSVSCGRVPVAAYLLAVFLEDGLVDSRRAGTVQVVPDTV